MENTQEIIRQIREFNRFYTVLLGFLNRNYLDSEYSVTETRILFELKQNPNMNANQLIEILHLDKSYISRLIRHFEEKEIIVRQTSPEDRRSFLIQLTPKGQEDVKHLIEMTNQRISELIEPLHTASRQRLCEAMDTIVQIFQNSKN